MEPMSNGPRAKFKDRMKESTPEATAALEQILRLAGAAPIPICSQFFTAAADAVKLVNDMMGNHEACKDVIATIQVYTERLDRYVKFVALEDIETSEELPAVFARDGIRKFEQHLNRFRVAVGKKRRKPFLLKLLTSSSIKDDIARLDRQLSKASEEFDSYTQDIQTMKIDRLATKPATDPEIEDFNIPGVVALGPQDMKPLETVEEFNNVKGVTFYRDIVKANVRGQIKLVKLYNKRSGGKEQFLRDLSFLKSNMSIGVLDIWGYASRANPAYMVLDSNHIRLLRDYLRDIKSLGRGPATLKAWKMMKQALDAVRFIHENEPDVTYAPISLSVSQAVVNDRGNVVIAPHPGWAPPANAIKWRGGWDFGVTEEHLVSQLWGMEFMKEIYARDFRGLGLALWSHPEAVLNYPLSDVDEASVNQLLSRWHPEPGKDRYLVFPLNCTSRVLVGDIGRWIFVPGHKYPFFEKLGNIMDSHFGGFRVVFGDNGDDFEQIPSTISHVVLRGVFRPNPEPRPSFPYDGLSVQWRCEHVHPEGEWDFLQRHASEFATSWGPDAQATDIVLITQTFHSFISGDLYELSLSKPRPMYFFIHIGPDTQILYSYWSRGPEPLEASSIDPSLQVEYEGTDDSIISHFGWRYLQLEPEDLVSLSAASSTPIPDNQ